MTPPADNPLPHYSGVRGPLVLNARNDGDQSIYDMTTELSLTSQPPPGGSTCGACYGEYGLYDTSGNADNEGYDGERYRGLIKGLFPEGIDYTTEYAGTNPRKKENCVNYTASQETGVQDWHNTYFIPGYVGITTDGAKGCCTHETGNPLGTFDGDDPSYKPCNSWQEAGESNHENPARTYGQGDCTCDEK